MDKSWILITDAHRARCFTRTAANHSLHEIADFVHPKVSLASVANGGDMTGAAGKGHGRTGHAGTQFEPHTEVEDKERNSFARELANYLNTSINDHRYDTLVIIASSPMLGELKPHLSHDTAKALKRCIASDLTHFTGPELVKHIDLALQPPG